MIRKLVMLGVLSLAVSSAHALEPADESLAEISNFLQYSPVFASAGQPTAEQYSALREAGFERVIYIAFTDNANAVPNADKLVKQLGMDYLHIPVDWNNPTPRDFYAFADAMQREQEMKTLLHCQVNARATAFSFLYRVVYEDVPVAEAKQDMDKVWQPNQTWRDLIFSVLADHDISPECEGCDWSVRS